MIFNIGVLIICTGKYQIFFDELYKSCENFFLVGHPKTYYVFTDGDINEYDNVKKIYQENLGWPNNTMKRFEIFNKIYEKLIQQDYLFFLNANMLFVDNVGDEVIPKKENNFLVGTQHPGYYNQNIDDYPYERRPESTLSVPFGVGNHYYQGCFNGGSSKNFLEMSSILSNKINEDLKNGITPIYHDESAINWYFLNMNPLLMDCGYSYPGNLEIPFTKKIIQRNKAEYGGYDYLRTP